MQRITYKAIATITIVSMVMLAVFAVVQTDPVFAKGTKPPKKTVPITVTLVTDAQGLGDFAFNDAAVLGLMLAEEQLKADTSVIESLADDYLTYIEQAILSSPDLIITSGFAMAEATAAAAAGHSDLNFAIIDSYVAEPNVASLLFKEHEGAFLVGVIAGLTTETNKIGCITGGSWPGIDKFVIGFQAGIQAVNPDAELVVDCIDTFYDPDYGYAEAMRLFGQGIDIIYHVAGPSGIGVINAAGDTGLWAIGCDVDQSNVNPNAVLCSMVKRVDIATYQTIKSVADGTFTGGPVEFGVAENGVGYSDNAGNVPEDIVAVVKKYEKAIRNGTIVVPYE